MTATHERERCIKHRHSITYRRELAVTSLKTQTTQDAPAPVLDHPP